MTPIIAILIFTIVIIIGALYYVRDITNKVTAKYFELKDLVSESEAKIDNARASLQEKIEEFRREIKEAEARINNVKEETTKRIEGFDKRLSHLEKEFKEIKGKMNILERLYDKVKELSESINSIEPDKLREDVKESVKSEILEELREEIENFEEMLEKKKDEELKEFLDILTISIDLPPERVKDGLMQAKLGLLSLRDISKVYVLTGKGVEEFEKLKENLVELLKEIRKLAVIAVPEDDVYSELTSVIVGLRRLRLPMEEDGKELPPEKSFIRIHNQIYDLTSKLDSIAEKVEGPIPVTPIEKEFYEKLKIQFENLKKLEKQVQELLATLGGDIEEEDRKEKKLDEIKKILEDLGL